MTHLKNEQEIQIIKNNSIILSNALAYAASLIKAGTTTLFINQEIEQFILQHQAKPSFKGYGGFPFSICASVNDMVVHGFPNDTPLKEGDIVSIDAGVYKDEFHSDSAYTFVIDGPIDENTKKFIQITKQSLYLGIAQAKQGNRVGDIGHAIQKICEYENGFGIVRDLVGHGIGKKLHESPSIPNYGKNGTGKKLQSGMVICIEPMITTGTHHVYIDKDNWTVRTKDKSLAAHFEHTVCIQKDKADILSDFSIIEKQEAQNKNLAIFQI